MTARIEKQDPRLDELTEGLRAALANGESTLPGIENADEIRDRIERVAAAHGGNSVEDITEALIAAGVHPDADFCRPIAEVIAAR